MGDSFPDTEESSIARAPGQSVWRQARKQTAPVRNGRQSPDIGCIYIKYCYIPASSRSPEIQAIACHITICLRTSLNTDVGDRTWDQGRLRSSKVNWDFTQYQLEKLIFWGVLVLSRQDLHTALNTVVDLQLSYCTSNFGSNNRSDAVVPCSKLPLLLLFSCNWYRRQTTSGHGSSI